MPTKDLKALIQLLRSQGVVSYKAEGIEILLDPNFQAPSRSRAAKGQPRTLQGQIDQMVPQMTEEEWLLAGVSADEGI